MSFASWSIAVVEDSQERFQWQNILKFSETSLLLWSLCRKRHWVRHREMEFWTVMLSGGIWIQNFFVAYKIESHRAWKQLKSVEKVCRVWFAEKRNWKIKKRANRANHNDTKSASSCTISKSTKSLSFYHTFPFVALSKYKNNFRQSSVMFSKIIKPIKIISESIFLPSPLAARCVWVWILSKAGRQAGWQRYFVRLIFSMIKFCW